MSYVSNSEAAANFKAASAYQGLLREPLLFRGQFWTGSVFVDAGYLFAQGSVALTGSKKPRTSITLDAPCVIAALKSLALSKAENCSLLRIYWYDGALLGGHLSSDQAQLAGLDDVKVCLGFINTAGQQKGVDSLIVTDLIELARQKAICDALLLSGDEDVRIGVQIAQNYGVRVHLIGIHPARGSQSIQLINEADTAQEWSAEILRQFMTVRVAAEPEQMIDGGAGDGTRETGAQMRDESASEQLLRSVASEFVSGLRVEEIEGVRAFWQNQRGVPLDLDRRLLPAGRAALGRDLIPDELRIIRAEFGACVRARQSSAD